MHVYKQLVPPSVVSHVVSGSFTGGGRNELLVVRGNSLLQLYKTSVVSTSDDGSSCISATIDANGVGIKENGNGTDSRMNEDEDPESAAEENMLTGPDSFVTEVATLQPEGESDKLENKSKLVLVEEWPLDGFVTDINKVRTVASSECDAVVISFRYAKMVILQWDSLLHTLTPISVHFYEKQLPFGTAPGQRSGGDRAENEQNQKGPAGLRPGFTSQSSRAASAIMDSASSVLPEHQAYHFVDPNFPSTFIVDPFSSCLCLLYQKDQMAFLPFTKEEDLDDFRSANGINGKHTGSDGAVIPGAAVPGTTANGRLLTAAQSSSSDFPPIYFPSFLVHASRLDEKIANIIDIAFLYEYREPTMAIIYEPVETWAPTAPLHKDTVQYLVLSLDLQNRSSTAIISIDSLPYDIDQVIPLPAPVGGSLLVGANHLIHIDSSGKVTGLAVNQFSKLVTKMSQAFFDQSAELQDLTLEGCTVIALETSTDVLVVLQSGAKYSLKFFLESRKVQALRLRPVVSDEPGVETAGITPTAGTSYDKNHIFIASATGDSTLLTWKHTEKDEAYEDAVVATTVSMSGTSGSTDKKSTHSTTTAVPASNNVTASVAVEDDIDDDDLYAEDNEDEKEEGGDSEQKAQAPAAESTDKPATKDDVDEEMYDDEYDDIYGGGASQATKHKKAVQISSSARASSSAPIHLSIDDTLRTYGPITEIVVGQPTTDKYIKYTEPADYLYDLVAATGSGPTGGLSVFQKTIRPKIVSDLNLNSGETPLIGVWALAPRSRVVAEGVGVTVLDSYVLATTNDASVLYRIGEEFANITDDTELVLSRTIGASVLLNGLVVVQVREQGISAYDSTFARVGSYNIESSPIIKCSFCDPYITLITAEGTNVLQLNQKDQSGAVTFEQVELHSELFSSSLKSGYVGTSSLTGIKFQTNSGPTRKKRKRDSESVSGKDTGSSTSRHLAVFVDNSDAVIVSKIT
ncbi:Cft1p [Sugiyamaella lignohabitans]|uniref:Cft1p n=1 Tax=Sugiyamaella lignohabitans TaxID=796027 RepID=A0A161HKI5_9ASCO|nr:Cft1p [Sugiyamaella lignohabitans]ANB12228.1 Cft1p [Sugiyamaella lignohabitans]